MLLSNQFPINYFSVSEVEQWWPDFADLYNNADRRLQDAGKFWRFSKVHDYGEDATRPQTHALLQRPCAAPTALSLSHSLCQGCGCCCLQTQQLSTTAGWKGEDAQALSDQFQLVEPATATS